MIKSGAKGYVLKDADPVELKLAFDELISRGYFYNELVTRKVMNSVMHLTEAKNGAGVFAKLSDREIEFLKLTCTELTYKEIAEKLYLKHLKKNVQTFYQYLHIWNLKSTYQMHIYNLISSSFEEKKWNSVIW